MNIEQIDKAFAQVIAQKGIYRQLKIKKNTVAQYRWKLKRGRRITLDKKLSVLQRAGYNLQATEFTSSDMVDLLLFVFRTSQAARDMGPAYLVEKWGKNKTAGTGKLKY